MRTRSIGTEALLEAAWELGWWTGTMLDERESMKHLPDVQERLARFTLGVRFATCRILRKALPRCSNKVRREVAEKIKTALEFGARRIEKRIAQQRIEQYLGGAK